MSGQRGTAAGIARLGATLALRLATLPWRRPGLPALRAPASILAIELSRMGDAIAATAALRALRRAFREAEIVYAVEEPWDGLFGPPVAAAVVAGRGTRTVRGFLRLVLDLRRSPRRYDLALNLSPSARNTLALLLCRARVRAGYLDLGSTLAPFRSRHPVFVLGAPARARVRFGPRVGICRRSIQVLLALGIPPEGLEPQVSIPSSARAEADRIVPIGRAGDAVPRICLHPGSGWAGRRWPPERWSALARHIVRDLGYGCALAGAEDDRSLLDAIVAASGVPALLLSGLSVPVLAACIARMTAFVGCDSGPLHLTAAMGVPAVGLFGPAPPRETAPAASRMKSLHVRRECCPCDQTVCLCPGAPCLEAISTEQVAACLEEVLSLPEISKPPR